MHTLSLDRWRHEHVFLGVDHVRNERRTWVVVGLTATMMVGEIVAGTLLGSLALVADGAHMATHAAALSIAALAYRFARGHAHDARFAFGTGKVGDLAAFASAVGLAVIALFIAGEALVRLASPVAIRFDQAIAVAVLGLVVNVASAWLLRNDGTHMHTDRPHHDHDHHRGAHDHNLRAAYLHVTADALTSVLAIVGLLAGRWQGWIWMDPLMALVGAFVIARWSWALIRDAGAVLLDTLPDSRVAETIRATLEIRGDRVSDLHVWRVGPGHHAAIVALVSDAPRPPAHYKALLASTLELSHVTIEVHPCEAHREA